MYSKVKKQVVVTIVSIFILNACSVGKNQVTLKDNPRPNIIIILADDMGYSDLGLFGSGIYTPNIDSLAETGLLMTQFYNASRCCPSRASLLTGLYQHQAGMGDMVTPRKEPAYQGFLNKNCVTIAEALKQTGYNTYMAGKWHVGSAKENWPVKRGFDHHFGLIEGASSYFHATTPYRPNQKLTIALDDKPYTPGKNWYSTDNFTDYALKYIKENKQTGKPFFLYMAYTSPHWPLQALPEDIAKYKGKFMNKGWDKLREERLAQMKKLGIVVANTVLPPLDSHVPEWSSLTEAEKVDWDDKMAVYAAMIDRMDQNIGRIRKLIRQMGEEDNTLIMFLSDNGSSSEKIEGNGFLPDIIKASKKSSSNPESFSAYGYKGANVSNTPFRLFKRWEYEGGTATPFIASWPSVIKQRLQTETPAHLIDLMATCLDVAKGSYPKSYNGNQIIPTEGLSLLPLMEGKDWKGHESLFFEHQGNRAVRQKNWKLVSEFPENKWQLYNIKTDRNELIDMSQKHPEIVKNMALLYHKWATSHGVIPYEKLIKKN